MSIRALFVQALLNKKNMQSEGYAFLTSGKVRGFINSNPYFCNIVAGFLSYIEKDDPRAGYIASVSAMVGDNIFWNGLRPAVLLAGAVSAAFGAYFLLPILFIIYNAPVALLRLKGYSYGKGKKGSMKTLFAEPVFTKTPMPLIRFKTMLAGGLSVYLLFNIYKYLQNSVYHAIITCFLLILLMAMKRRVLPFVLFVLTIIYFAGAFIW